MKKFYSILFIAFVGIITFQWSSCKGPQPCKGIITVYDSAGTRPQAGAAVYLYAQVNYNGSVSYGDLKANGVTDAAGQYSITIKNPCILDVRATIANCDSGKVLNPKHKYCMGTAILVFEAGKTNSKSVYIKQ
ncbi:MAG TPA: hypothetical protein VF411_15140 [Bacteroidia bacterium]